MPTKDAQPLLGNVVASEPNMVYQYYIDLVPTIRLVGGMDGRFQDSLQHTARRLETPLGPARAPILRGVPGVYFIFSFSPFHIYHMPRRFPFFKFMVKLFAILGGVVSLVRLGDRVFYSATTTVVGKLLPKPAAPAVTTSAYVVATPGETVPTQGLHSRYPRTQSLGAY